MVKLLLSLVIISLLTACGKGGTSSSGDAGDPITSKSCIEFERDSDNDDDSTSTFTNSCDYDINVAELDGGSNEDSFIVLANSSRTIDRYFVTWGACRTPYIVDEDRPFNYRCVMQ